MSETVHVYDFTQLERGILGLENMRLTDTLIDKVPLVADRIVVNDFFRPRDGQTSLAIIPHDGGLLEIIGDNETPIEIEYFDVDAPRTPIQVLSSPVRSLTFEPVGFRNHYQLVDEENVLHWAGLENFTRLVAGRALKKQREAGLSVSTYAKVA
jgi:hypothetical protein